MARVIAIVSGGKTGYILGDRRIEEDDRGDMMIANGGFLPGRFRLPALGRPLIFETAAGTQIVVGAQQFETPRSSSRRRPDPWAAKSFGLT